MNLINPLDAAKHHAERSPGVNMQRWMSDPITHHIVYRATESENLRRTLKGLFKKDDFMPANILHQESHLQTRSSRCPGKGKNKILWVFRLKWKWHSCSHNRAEGKKGKFNLRYKTKTPKKTPFLNTSLPQLGYRGPQRYQDIGKLMMLFMLQMNQGQSVSSMIEGVCNATVRVCQCNITQYNLTHLRKGKCLEWPCVILTGTKILSENFGTSLRLINTFVKLKSV